MNSEEHYERGFALRCEGRYGEAKMAFLQALSIDPNHWKSHWQLALIKGFEGDFDGSIEDLQKLSNQYPQNIDILNDLGMTSMMLGYQDEACAAFQKILLINPDHENAQRQAKFC